MTIENEVENVVESEVVELDLSAVPEAVRKHVDADKYQADADYKRAVEHGWKPKEVYVEEGGDEADWTGYRKYNKSYDDNIYRRELRDEVKTTKKSVDALISTFEQEKQQAVQRALSEREEKLKLAIADGDAARAVELSNEIHQHKSTVVDTKPVMEPLPIRDMRRKNAFINPESPAYDAALSDEFIGIARQKAEAYYNQYGRALSDYEIKVIAEEAFDMVKDKAKKPALQKPPVVAAPSQKKTTGDPKLNDFQRKWRDRLLDMPDGKRMAESYVKNLTSNA